MLKKLDGYDYILANVMNMSRYASREYGVTYNTELFMSKLAEKGLSGSAVVPNLDNDEDWSTFYEALKQGCKSELATIAGNQTTGSQ